MRLLIILLMFPLSLIGQPVEFEKKDSIQIDNLTFPTYTLKINSYSESDPAKVFVVPIKSFDSLNKEIPKLYFSKKQEHNEYYVLAVEDMSQTLIVNRAVTEFLNQIDSARVARNRSTFLRRYSLDSNHKPVYQTATKDLSQVENLHYLHAVKDLCKYLACPKK